MCTATPKRRHGLMSSSAEPLRSFRALTEGSSTMANKGPMLQTNGIMFVNDYLLSQSGQYQVVLQQDGNLVIYDLWNNHKPIWSSNTHGKAVNLAVMQGDGNFVIYGFPEAVWSTNTAGKGNCFITMQDDGNLVVYEVAAPVWASKGR